MGKRLESHLETDVTKWAKDLGGFAVKLVLASESGWPDRTIWLPGGRVIIPELKKPGGDRRRNQEIWVKRLQDLGFDSGFCDTLQDVERLYLTKEKRGRI